MYRTLTSIILALLLFFSTGLSGQQTEVIYLSGTGYDDTKEWDFYCSDGMNSGQWAKISVPSHWEQEGFGEYTYGRWYKQRGKRPSSETGHYKTSFFAPSTWKDQTVLIVFEGVMTDTKVMINNTQAGEIHQGGFYRFKYDISDLIRPGVLNQLEVIVSKHSSDRTVNAAERMADWWLFGGIYRPVYLEILPGSHISEVKMDPRADGTLAAQLKIKDPPSNGMLHGVLRNVKGEVKGSFDVAISRKDTTPSVLYQFENIYPWSPETPNLYEIELNLISKGIPVHSVKESIGFRTIEVRPGDGIYCNGVKVIMKGINRHTFWPESGRCTSKEISVLDATLIKQMNMNAVRCHYPPDEHFLDACDSIGLFFIDELAGWQNPYRTEIGSKLVREMIDRDVNHPSVIMWSNGNEGGWNEEIDPLFASLDPQERVVIHPWADFGDIDTHHYPQYQTGVHRFNDGFEIFMPTEFLHGLYDEGHGAGLEDFWAKWTSHPLFAGGFLWAYNDGAIKRSDTGLHDSDGQHAPDGVVGPYREKEGSFFTIRDVWAPIQFDQLVINSSFNGEFLVSNKYLFTNLDRCTMQYRISTVPGPFEQAGESVTLEEGPILLPSIEPGEKRKIVMPVSGSFFDGDLLSVSAKDPNGREIYTWTWPIRFAGAFLDRKSGQVTAEGASNIKSTFERSGNRVKLYTGNTSVTFDTTSGYILSMYADSILVPLSGGPVPVGMKAYAYRSTVRQERGNAVYTVWYKGGIDSIRWELTPAGRLKMSMIALTKYRDDGGFDGGFVEGNIYHWGLTFDFPEEVVTGMTWFGKGPYRVWKNRQRGTAYGLWSKAYNNTITGESFENLVYPEFKGYHANVYWASIATKNKTPLTIASESDGLYLRVLTPQEPSGSLNRSLPVFPSGDISLLYEINPIHAFKPVSQMGPGSAPSSIRIKKGDEGISMVVWFDLNGL